MRQDPPASVQGPVSPVVLQHEVLGSLQQPLSHTKARKSSCPSTSQSHFVQRRLSCLLCPSANSPIALLDGEAWRTGEDNPGLLLAPCGHYLLIVGNPSLFSLGCESSVGPDSSSCQPSQLRVKWHLCRPPPTPGARGRLWAVGSVGRPSSPKLLRASALLAPGA